MSAKSPLEKKVMAKLSEVMDPELYISVVDLGLIYKVTVKDTKVKINMTLTTIGCPLFSVLESDIKGRIARIKGIDEVDIKLVFDPPWTIDRMSEKAKAMIGL